jgi:hypothetical protein
MIDKPTGISPGEKAHVTAKWACTMTKWLVTYSHRNGARWNVIEFEGKNKREARGVVDMMAIRKNHRKAGPGLKRGDLFEIVLIQVKGGSARRPTDKDKARLKRVAQRYKAMIVLAEWQKRKKLALCQLKGNDWEPIAPSKVFG